MKPIATLGALVQVTPWNDLCVRQEGNPYFLDDRTPFAFRVEGRLEDGQIFYGLFGPVVSGPERYKGLVCNIVIRADESDWRISAVCQAAFYVGPTRATRDHRYDFREPDGLIIEGEPVYMRFGEIRVIEESQHRPDATDNAAT